MSKKTYNSKEISKMFNISQPRLLQFRKGQIVKHKTNDENVIRQYKFDPLLIEGKDWYWNGSEVIYNESCIIKLKNRKKYNKYNGSKISKEKAKQIKENSLKLKDGEYTVQDIAEKTGLTVQKIYTLRDMSTNKPVGYTDYLIQNKDWKYIGGKVILLESAKPKIMGYADLLKERKDVPKSKRITILIGNKVFNLTGEESKAVIEIIKRKQGK